LCRFASSNLALKKLAAGHTHLAGTHLHNSEAGKEANVERAKELMTGGHARVVGFSMIEEGLIVARGNPLAIRSVADLADPNVRFVNRERGAALRLLLDDHLQREGVAFSSINGYDRIAFSHAQAAQQVAMTGADASLGLRAMAMAFDLGFVSLATVRCDLVIPLDLLEHPTLNIVLEVLHSEPFRKEMASLPGYGTESLGKVIAEF
jgi:molybdate-binding protein